MKAKQEGRLRQTVAVAKTGQHRWDSRTEAMKGWAHIIKALADSESSDDRKLAERVAGCVRAVPFLREAVRQRQREAVVVPRQQPGAQLQPQPRRAMDRPGLELER